MKGKVSRTILTGIQSSGRPHLGNILGAMEPAFVLAADNESEALFFIADLHSLTSLHDPIERAENTAQVAMAWLACGGDRPFRLYRQSRVPEVAELMWYLSCFTQTGLLLRSHAYRTKVEVGGAPRAGLLTYPVLMAADILLYDATHVPVGRDQQEHIDITRDLARSFNHSYGDHLVMPQGVVMTTSVPGVDGAKMSKSYGNTIDIFAPEKELRRAVNRIRTEAIGVDAPKDPDQCTIAQIHALVAPEHEVKDLALRYREGRIGFGEAKTVLADALLSRFGGARERFLRWQSEPEALEARLMENEAIMRDRATSKLQSLRRTMGFS